jgi:diketogulonate reductase-like aldo/keto reductase
MATLGMPAMTYSPLDEGRLVDHPGLRPIAAELGSSCAQAALAWLLESAPGVLRRAPLRE